MSGRTRIAALDVDGTIVDGQTQAVFVRYLLSKNLLSLRTAAAVAMWFIRYRLGLQVDPVGIRRRVFGELAGLSHAHVQALVDEVFDSAIRQRIRPAAAAEVKRLSSTGIVVVLVSASVEPLVRRIACEINAADVIATRLESADDTLTGRISGAVVEGNAKLTALKHWANARFDSWELAAAYGDHLSDAPLLEAAQQAWAVCPDAGLRSEALRRGWTCLDWVERV